MFFNGQTRVMLASNSQFFLRGISGLIRSECGNIKVVTEALKQKVEKRLVETKPQFLLLDNRSFRLDVQNLLNLISEKGLGTRVILLNGRAEYEFNFSNVVYLNKETSSSELINIISREGLTKGDGNGTKKRNVR